MLTEEPIAKASHLVSYSASALCVGHECDANWLDKQADAVIALTAIASFFIALAGFGVRWFYFNKRGKK